MKALSESGEYQITAEELAEITSVFAGVCADDDEGAAAIRNVFNKEHYLMDTHTSIAWACMEKLDAGHIASGAAEHGAASVVLSTASPYKFSRAVLEALGEDVSESDEANMNRVHEVTGAPVPEGLAGIFSREVRHGDVIGISDMKDYVIGKSK
jgi:threonine synthase